MPVTEDIVITPCMLQAIEEHKYLQSCELCRELDILEAIRDFRQRHESRWLADKTRADNLDQVCEISKHLWSESEKAGRDVGRTTAGLDWIRSHACEWRQHRESLSFNSFVGMRVELPGPERFGPEGLQHLVEEVSLLYCDVFVSQPGMRNPHFYLQIEGEQQRKPFVLVAPRALDRVLQLRLEAGRHLDVIAYGEDSQQALELTRRTIAASRAVSL